MIRHRVHLVCLSALLTIFFIGCERSEEKVLPTESPLVRVTVRAFTPFAGISSWSQTVTIALAKEAEIRTLVDLRVFGDLQPGVTAEQAEARFGKPSQVHTDDFGTTWYGYKTPLGRAEVGCDKRTSPAEGGKEVTNAPCWWALYAYTDQPPDTIFRGPILSQLHAAERMKSKVGERSLELLDSDGHPILQAWWKESRISRMRLYKHLDR